MPTAPDGILTATFDPVRCLVALATDGEQWPEPVDTLTLTRTSSGAGTIPVRGVLRRTTIGGVLLWSDNEAPLDGQVTYDCTGYDAFGSAIATSSVTVSTATPQWGLWVKAPGRADLTCRVTLRSAGDMARAAQGGIYQVPGGPAIAQSSGLAALTTTIEISTDTAAQNAAVLAVVDQAPGQILLLQTGQPEELPSGYYHAASLSQTNPAELRSDVVAYRHLSINVTRVAMPAGEGSGFFGVSHDSIANTYASHQAIADAVGSHFELAQGA